MKVRLYFAGVICLSLIIIPALFIQDVFAGVQKAKVAVSDFKLEGGGHDQPKLGVILAELLTEELVRQGRVMVVERLLMKKILDEKKLAMSGITSGDSAAAGTLLGVDYILGGSDMRIGDTSNLTGRFIDTKTGIIVASEDISYHEDNELRAVARNLADMLGRNFKSDGAIVTKKNLDGNWEAFSSDGSRSRFIEKSGGSGIWSYKVRDGEEDYAGLTFHLGARDIRGKNLLITCRSKNSYPLYIRFYSFVPGFSKEDNDETLVPVEKLVRVGRVAVEIEAPHHKMRVPKWWREENGAPKVKFNPDDIRQFELEASEDAAEGSGKDQIEILRITVQ